MRFSLLSLLLLLGACSSKSSGSKSAYSFYNSHLLFDLNKEVERVPCVVKGTIPSWLSGTLLRNGPAKFTVGDAERVSWFDGLPMLHAFEFSSEKVLYSNRFLRCENYYVVMKGKSLDFPGFAQDPCPVRFKSQLSKWVPKEARNIQAASVSIQEYADQMVALTESPLPVRFDSTTLETLGNFSYADRLPQAQIWESAHPLRDPITKETFNYLVDFGEKSAYVIWKMEEHSSERKVVNRIPVDLPAYMHSFALTEHYQILVEFPFVVNPSDLIHSGKPFIFNYTWKPERGTTFYVTERSTGDLVATLKSEPFFAFHHVNAYDEGKKIVMDIVTEPNADVIGVVTEQISDPKRIMETEKTLLERFTIDLNTQAVVKETLFDGNVEMPRVASERISRPYRYCYLIDPTFPSGLHDVRPLYKIDVQNNLVQEWGEEGCFPGEPIFVSHPGGGEEDEGVVLSLVLDLRSHTSFLLILDGQSFEEVARVEAPHAIPLGLHGYWRE